MNLKKIGKVFTSTFVGTGPSSYKKRIYQAVVSQRLRNTDLEGSQVSPSRPCDRNSEKIKAKMNRLEC